MLKITNGKGFQIVLHDWTLSVQFGAGNYCDNYDQDIFAECTKPAGKLRVESSDAEIALWRLGGDMIPIGHDTVAGWVPALVVGKLIGFLADSPKSEEQVQVYLAEQGVR